MNLEIESNTRVTLNFSLSLETGEEVDNNFGADPVSFVMGDFTKEIHFGGKQLVIWGNNATLDAKGKGRFFSSTKGGGPNDDDNHGPAGKTSLELHDLVMQNGKSDSVSFQFSCLF